MSGQRVALKGSLHCPHPPLFPCVMSKPSEKLSYKMSQLPYSRCLFKGNPSDQLHFQIVSI